MCCSFLGLYMTLTCHWHFQKNVFFFHYGLIILMVSYNCLNFSFKFYG